MVYATGMATPFGTIAGLTMGLPEEQSPLQKEINRMTTVVSILAISSGIAFFLLSVFVLHRPVSAGFMFSLGMVVAFVPEGLLPTVTLALAMAMRFLPPDHERFTSDAVERQLIFLGLAAMLDPPRDEVAVAVATCRRAGIRIIMITGDYGLTAESIARRIGIVGLERPRILSGQDLDGMDDSSIEQALRGEVLFARVAPEHKLRVVSILQGMGHVVAVTGDGVNDAPALKKADIGVAMGSTGTDVARETADMVLADDNFSSIVHAIEEGRAVYANIRKFVTYIFSSNMPEAWPFILQLLFNIPLALNVMQILAIDLGTDMVPALALGAERPEPGIMDRPAFFLPGYW